MKIWWEIKKNLVKKLVKNLQKKEINNDHNLFPS